MSTRPTSGRFVGHDLLTSDPEAAAKFYGELLGWTFEAPVEGATGQLIRSGGHNIGGLGSVPKDSGLVPQWLMGATVSSVEKGVDLCESLGGKTLIRSASGTTKFALISDPHGAVIQLIEEASPKPEQEQVPFGQFCWTELLTKDAENAGKFYGELFGWSLVHKDMGPVGIYHLCLRGDKQEAGIWPMPAEAVRPVTWLGYIHVENAEASTERLQELGGFVLRDVTAIPTIGRFSVVLDPQGARFALFTPEA
jgi:predicted enzyme related to lactoylglutathione lyase